MSEAPLPPTNLQGVDERSPSRAIELFEEVQKEFEELHKKEKEALVKNGALTFSRLKPAERLQGYYDDTLSYDLDAILNPTYLLERRLGAAEPLLAEQMLKEQARIMGEWDVASMQAQMEGLPPQPAPKFPDIPKLWVMLLPNDLNPDNPIDDWFWEYHAKDLRDLRKAESI